MPCVAHRTDKTHHSPLNPCVLVIIHVDVAFRADLAAISLSTSTTQHPGKKFRTLFASRAWATCDVMYCFLAEEGVPGV